MGDGRGIFDDLRNGIDALERATGDQLDRWAAPAHRRDRDEPRKPSPEEPARRTGRPVGKLERKAARAARKASRAAEKAARHAGRRRHASHSRKRGSRQRAEADDLSPEELEARQALRRARHRANRRLGFLTHFGTYVFTLVTLVVFTRGLRVPMIVGFFWGIGLFSHYFFTIVAPRLRDRWVEREVGVRSERSVKQERRVVETRSRRSMEDLSASIAHEIRNPITAAKSLVQQMGEDPASDENLEYAGLALSELDRVERSISHLLRYARDEEPRFEAMRLAEVARRATDGLADRAAGHGIVLGVEFDREGAMRGDPEKLRRVVENFVANAIDALVESGAPLPRIDVLGGENLAGTEAWLRIVDNGPGIPADERDLIWSPFYTTKESGTGLGLALSRKAVEAHGGRVELLSDARQGTEFVLTFPKDPKDAQASRAGGDDHAL